MVTRGHALAKGAERLRLAGIANPRLEARLLLAELLGLSVEAVLCSLEATADVEQYQRLLERRAAREPLALLLGRREFWSLEFAVSGATLIPRPEFRDADRGSGGGVQGRVAEIDPGFRDRHRLSASGGASRIPRGVSGLESTARPRP